MRLAALALACGTLLGAAAASAGPAAKQGGDWTRFGYTSTRSNAGPAKTGLTAANVGSLVRQQVALGGTVDSSPLYVRGRTIKGAASRRLHRPDDIRARLRDRGGQRRRPLAVHAGGLRLLRRDAPDHDRQPGGRRRPRLRVLRLSGRARSQAHAGRRSRDRQRGMAGADHARPRPREDHVASGSVGQAGHRDDVELRRCPSVPGARGHDRSRQRPHRPRLERALQQPGRADGSHHLSERRGHEGPIRRVDLGSGRSRQAAGDGKPLGHDGERRVRRPRPLVDERARPVPRRRPPAQVLDAEKLGSTSRRKTSTSAAPARRCSRRTSSSRGARTESFDCWT